MYKYESVVAVMPFPDLASSINAANGYLNAMEKGLVPYDKQIWTTLHLQLEILQGRVHRESELNGLTNNPTSMFN